MATIENLASPNFKELDMNADLVEELAASGAITEAEQKSLLDMFRDEHQADRESGLRRARFAPPTNLHLGEQDMNANDIVSQIEYTRSVMAAQLKKLNEFTPAPVALSAEVACTRGMEDILVATVAGHIANTVDSLRAIAVVEKAICAPVANACVTESDTALANVQVIDA